MKLKRVVSGIQPSGVLHIGNYFGAVKNWIKLANDINTDCYFFIADHHSFSNKFIGGNCNSNNNTSSYNEINIYTPSNESGTSASVIQTASCLLAAGLDPKKVVLFTQSNIPAHAELMWILSCMSPLSWLNKMIQFKEKSKNQYKDMSSTALYTYPILMAADILLYKAEEVPVGDDQIQHVELTRDIAERLNKFSKTEKQILPLPNYVISYGRVMSLQNGKNKMSKSDKNTHSTISLISSEEEITQKILKAKTDSIGKLTYDPQERPEISNLISIYSHCHGFTIEQSIQKFESATTYEFKLELIKSLNELILPISYKAKNLIEKDFDYVRDILREGRKSALIESEKNLAEIKDSLNYFC
jgi:tryptophanyl-tRNA synthetase